MVRPQRRYNSAATSPSRSSISNLVTDDGFVARFRREAVASARLQHRSIVAVYDTISTPEIEAIVMELIEGETLRTLLDAKGAAVAHASGLVHHDIKSANIMVRGDGRVKVTDFGIANRCKLLWNTTVQTRLWITFVSIRILNRTNVQLTLDKAKTRSHFTLRAMEEVTLSPQQQQNWNINHLDTEIRVSGPCPTCGTQITGRTNKLKLPIITTTGTPPHSKVSTQGVEEAPKRVYVPCTVCNPNIIVIYVIGYGIEL